MDVTTPEPMSSGSQKKYILIELDEKSEGLFLMGGSPINKDLAGEIVGGGGRY